MPNWVETCLTVTGPGTELKRFIETARGRKARPRKNAAALSFEHFIPMPAEIRAVPADSDTDLALTAYGSSRNRRTPLRAHLAARWAREAGITNRKSLQAWLDQHQPELRERARQCEENLRHHGSADWYDWANRNWGCKWDAHESQITEAPPTAALRGTGDASVEYQFRTPWTPAETAILAMSRLFPQLHFTAVFYAEGAEFYFKGEYGQGKKLFHEDLEDDDEDAEDFEW